MGGYSYISGEVNKDCPDYGGEINIDELHDLRKRICKVGNVVCSEKCRINGFSLNI
jgi:hypothetical protein